MRALYYAVQVSKPLYIVLLRRHYYLNGIFGIMKTFAYGTKKQVFQACTRGILKALQDYMTTNKAANLHTKTRLK